MPIENTGMADWFHDLLLFDRGATTGGSHALPQLMLEYLASTFEGDFGALVMRDGEDTVAFSVLASKGDERFAHLLSEDALLVGMNRSLAAGRDAATGTAAGTGQRELWWPLHANGTRIGALLLGRDSDSTCFGDTVAESLGTLSPFLSIIVDNAWLHESQQRRIDALSLANREVEEANRQLKDAQQQLLQSEKMASIGQLAAGVAHEINNPIGYVHSNLGSLETYIEDLFTLLDAYASIEDAHPEHAALFDQARSLRKSLDVDFLVKDVHALLAETREGIGRVKKIVQDLKDFSHVGTEDEWQWADLHKGLDSTLNIVNNEIKYKATVVKEYGSLPEIECLPSQLNQVFMNLLVNAAHAIEDRGTIVVRTGTEADSVWVEIADTGKGIAPENIERIFDPFFTTKPVGKGTGLGLSLSYSIVQKHGGYIHVCSEPGRGTTFRVTLSSQRPAESA